MEKVIEVEIMILSNKTLEKLTSIINGDGTDDYRKGYQLVNFFNDLGFNDTYGSGFPARWSYTNEKLQTINGTPELDKCIKKTFAVVDFIGRIKYLDDLIADFNQYLAFDKWKLIRANEVITFKRLDKVVIEETKDVLSSDEDEFMKRSFNINIDLLGLESSVNSIISNRLTEVETCIKSGAPLAAVIMMGSILEGILLGLASSYPRQFNQTHCAPKDPGGNVKKFQDWTLNNFIEASFEIGLIKQDVKKFSHVVRDFRNYIHPYSQLASKFSPDEQTALICLQVLKAAIYQIGEYMKVLRGGN